MPPLRTLPPAKPVKTERTHAENQERAYIAASRRSDRSLEARVESARRASEIHKKRTGRSLRVTEADVINEEMYEEEDDDLPAQIRRITAHLHTGNDPFNRRLQAYVANHIAMRSALGQVVADNWQQQQMQNNTINSYLNQGMMQQQQNQPFAFQSPMLPPQTPASGSPQMFRSSPYPTNMAVNGMPSPRPGTHVRSASLATPQELTGTQPSTTPSQQSASATNSPVETRQLDHRRFSMPQSGQALHDQQPAQSDNKQHFDRVARPGPLNLVDPFFSNPFGLTMGSNTNFAPLTPSLPLESQQLLAGAPIAELSNPAMAAMMQSHVVPTPGGNFTSSPGFYSYNPNGSKGKSKASSPMDSEVDGNRNPSTTIKTNMGMNATLAPSMLDVVAQPPLPSNNLFGDNALFSPQSPAGFGMGFDSALGTDLAFTHDGLSSGQLTPGETDWNMWIESQALGDETNAAATNMTTNTS